MGSQSLASAVERSVSLRRFYISGTVALVLWLLSPLGGQSSLRILGFTNTLILSEGQIHYFNTTSISFKNSIFSSGDDYSSFIVSALLDASLMQSDNVLSSPVDQWNNVKIPRLDDLSPFTDATPENPWISLDQTSHKAWSSLTGLMIQHLPVAGISTFTLESTYIDLSCTNSNRINEDQPVAYQQTFKSRLKFHNASRPFESPHSAYHANMNSSFFMDTDSVEFSPEDDYINTPLNLLYASNLGINRFLDLFNRSVGTARVESEITCHGSSCATNRMRRSEIYSEPPFDMPFNPVTYENML